LVFTLLWLVHPCFAATTQSHTPSTKKNAAKHTPHKQSKASKKTTRHTSKKTSSKKTQSPRSTKKSKKTRHGQHRVTSTPSTAVSNRTTTINTPNVTKTYLPGYLLTSIEKNLVDAVRKTIATLRYTAYKLGGTRIDPSRGIYVVDCSSYVDHVLKTLYPRAYTSLTNWSGTEKPTTNDFYHYFTNLSDDDESHWNTIEDVEKLRPGDILVFRYKNKIGNARGHVMIVMDKPIRTADAFLVRVSDAAPTGHSTDTRMPHASGIGIGSLLLKVDAKTYRPYAYAWKIGSRWEKNVNFAMARPIRANA
jgi:cell wall-associated NlpC family hydrolase